MTLTVTHLYVDHYSAVEIFIESVYPHGLTGLELSQVLNGDWFTSTEIKDRIIMAASYLRSQSMTELEHLKITTDTDFSSLISTIQEEISATESSSFANNGILNTNTALATKALGTIYICTSGEETLEYPLRADMTVEHLKLEIKGRERLEVYQRVLRYNGKEIANHKPLAKYGVFAASFIDLDIVNKGDFIGDEGRLFVKQATTSGFLASSPAIRLSHCLSKPSRVSGATVHTSRRSTSRDNGSKAIA